MIPSEDTIYRLDHVTRESPEVLTLSFAPEAGELMQFHAGQYVYVDMIERPKRLPSRPYSISSSPSDAFVSVSVKKLGAFSGALHELTPGSRVILRGPAGNFIPQPSMKKLVFIAGGIGIAPFLSILKGFVGRNAQDQEVLLFYSNKRREDIVFFGELQGITQALRGVRIVYCLTQQEEKADEAGEYRRFDGSMLKQYCSKFGMQDYFLCGSVPFVTETSQVLEHAGVLCQRIHAELFY